MALPYLGEGCLNWVWHSFKCKTPHSWVPAPCNSSVSNYCILFLFPGGCHQIPWHISITNLASCHSDHRKPRREEYTLKALFHLHSSLQQQNSLKSLEVWSEWKVFCLNSTPYRGIVSKSQIYMSVVVSSLRFGHFFHTNRRGANHFSWSSRILWDFLIWELDTKGKKNSNFLFKTSPKKLFILAKSRTFYLNGFQWETLLKDLSQDSVHKIHAKNLHSEGKETTKTMICT